MKGINGRSNGLTAGGEVSYDQCVLAAMADAHGGVARSYMTAVVAVK